MVSLGKGLLQVNSELPNPFDAFLSNLAEICLVSKLSYTFATVLKYFKGLSTATSLLTLHYNGSWEIVLFEFSLLNTQKLQPGSASGCPESPGLLTSRAGGQTFTSQPGGFSNTGHLYVWQFINLAVGLSWKASWILRMTQLGAGVELWFQTTKQEHHLFLYTVFIEHLSWVRAHGHLPSYAFMLLYSNSLSQALFSRWDDSGLIAIEFREPKMTQVRKSFMWGDGLRAGTLTFWNLSTDHHPFSVGWEVRGSVSRIPTAFEGQSK